MAVTLARASVESVFTLLSDFDGQYGAGENASDEMAAAAGAAWLAGQQLREDGETRDDRVVERMLDELRDAGPAGEAIALIGDILADLGVM